MNSDENDKWYQLGKKHGAEDAYHQGKIVGIYIGAGGLGLLLFVLLLLGCMR